MSLFKKLFGRVTKSANPAPPPAASTEGASPSGPSKDPNLIRVFDSYGRELFITRQQWRDDVLRENLRQVRNRPEELYAMIVSALNDGFRSDVIDAARQLYRIDPIPSRGACVWGIVLMEESRLDEAEKIFRDYLAKHGEEGVILTNLAKVYAKRQNDAKAEEILWHALELDPNQDNGMGWYEAIHREREGEAAGQEALRRIATLPGSWRAQVWLARTALQARQLDRALDLYRESLSRVGRPIPADVLMQVSGDLGNAGHLPELLAIAEPHFDPVVHGLQVGNNLIKAHLDLGQIDAARRILDRLYALKRPDWRETLSFWDTEIARTRLDPSPSSDPASMEIAMLTIEGPIWLRPDSPAAELFPAKSREGPRVAVLGSSAESATNSKRVQHQLADTPGRLSRALPLFLAEQVEFGSAARTNTLVPWIVRGSCGFVLSGAAWSDDAAAQYARQGEGASDYVVISHLQTQAEPWVVTLRFVRTIDGKCLAELRSEFAPATPETALPDLAHRLLAAMATEVPSLPASGLYRFPGGDQFPYYLLRLEQLLATRCGAMEGVPAEFLSGERDIIDGNLQLCLASPESVPARLLLVQTLCAMKRVRPDILPEFRDRVLLLQKEKPLAKPAHSVAQRMVADSVGH